MVKQIKLICLRIFFFGESESYRPHYVGVKDIDIILCIYTKISFVLRPVSPNKTRISIPFVYLFIFFFIRNVRVKINEINPK